MLWVKIFLFGCLVSSIELVPSTTKLSTKAVAMGRGGPARGLLLILGKSGDFRSYCLIICG